MLRFINQVSSRPLLGIMLLGLAARVFFLLIGAPYYYHSADTFYFNGDSSSFTNSFENLWQTGRYTFDVQVPEAAYGRLPVYPFFYGLHRIIFGAALAPAATAWSQVLLDTTTIGLVFAILKHLTPGRAWAPLVGALLYATYPFIIIWTPIIGTEALSTDLTLLWMYLMVRWRPTAVHTLGVGAVAALILLIRAYMGVLLPITLLWIAVQSRPLGWHPVLRQIVLVVAGFVVVYIGWPVRNYLLSNEIILLKPRAAGYLNQTPDVDEYYQWVHCWDLDENPWLDSVLIGKGPVHFPSKAFDTPAQAARAQALVGLARQCGSGFYVLRGTGSPDSVMRRYRSDNCNATISNGFRQLREEFAARHPLRFWFDVPLQNLSKALFKSSLTPAQALHPRTPSRATVLVTLLFGYRSLLLLLGWGGLLWGLRRWPALGLVLAVSGGLYGYICFLYRGLEMRYLIQSDVLLLLPAALLLGHLIERLQRRAPAPLTSEIAA